MNIRPLDPADAAAFQALRLDGLQECPTAFASSFEEESGRELPAVAERLAPQGDRAVLGAFVGGELVGVVGVMREGHRKLAHKAFIWGMYVAPAARKRGIGRELVAKALSFAATGLAVRQVTLGVNAANEAAIALYERMGFKAYGREPCFMLVDGVPQDEVQMVCFLHEEASLNLKAWAR